MSLLTGTGSLLRLALRRDRIQLPIWLVSIIGIVSAQLSGLHGAYATEQARLSYATTMSASAPARMFGSIDGPAMGSILMVEIYATIGIVVALMSSMLVVRHTRQNEQTGRLELVGSAIVGRHASLVAALTLAVLANVVVVVGIWVVLVALELPTTGALIFALALGGIGITFAGAAAVAAQVANSSRGANGLVGLVLGATFLLRAAGDVFGTPTADGLAIVIAWPSWLSPLGWGQLAYPFVEQRWGALAMYVAAFVVLALVALVMSAERDIGRGLLPARRAAAVASRGLSSPLGLALRLQRGVWLGWLAGMVLVGATLGSFAGEFDTLLEGNDAMRELITRAGGSDVLAQAYYAISMAMIGVTLTIYVVQAMLRLREEEHGALEQLLAAPVTRTRWLASHVFVGAIGSVLLLAATGLATAATAEFVGDESIGAIGIFQAALVQAPGVLAVAAFAVFVFGLAPRLMMPLAWGAVALCVLVYIGDLFRLPDLLLDVSPFSHLPVLPSSSFDWTPIVVVSLVAVALAVAGGALFRRRDVSSS